VIAVWRQLGPLLPRRNRRLVLSLVLLSLIAGVLEAVLLVLVVGVALVIAEGSDVISIAIPVVGTVEVAPTSALAAAGLAGVIAVVVHLGAAHLTSALATETLRLSRERAVLAFSRASWARQAQEREGALQETVSSLSMQTSALVVYLAELAKAVMALVALLLTALLVDWLVTIFVLAFGLLLFASLRPLSALTERRARAWVAGNSRFTEEMSQWTGLAMELRVFGVDHAEAERLIEENSTIAETLRLTRVASLVGGHLYRDLAILFLVGAMAGLYVIADIDLGAVGAVVLLVVRSVAYAQGVQSSVQNINEQSPNLAALTERLETLEASAECGGSRRLDSIDRISLHRVSYEYAPGQPGVENVGLDIEAGESVGVIGPSGGGKSTLVQVLLRLRPPTAGTVTVSGIPYTEVAPESWHRLVAMVPQEPKLFRGTVAENIAFFRGDITRARIEQAAADAHVIDDIRRMPQGFDTDLGPRGAGLSGGQKQRIVIARALAGDPQLLVLDEPTSALDVRSEQLLQDTISALHGRVTLVIVAHRISTLTICDRVVAMADGRIVTVGTLEQALAKVEFRDRVVVPTVEDTADADGPAG
jgi:ATP-binding cassette, subfamily B, bacterial